MKDLTVQMPSGVGRISFVVPDNRSESLAPRSAGDRIRKIPDMQPRHRMGCNPKLEIGNPKLLYRNTTSF